MKMATEYILSSFSHFLLVHTNICLFASWNTIFPHMHTVKTLLANHRMSILIESDLLWWQWPSYIPSPSLKWISSYRPIHVALTPNSIWIMYSSIWKDLWQIFKVCMWRTFKEYWTCAPMFRCYIEHVRQLVKMTTVCVIVRLIYSS